MQGSEEPRKGAGLEYMHLDVKDDYRDGTYRHGHQPVGNGASNSSQSTSQFV